MTTQHPALTLADLTELKAKAEAATPGPFGVERRDDDCGYMNYIVHGAKRAGYCYGADALEQVRFGWEIAHAAQTEPLERWAVRVLDAWAEQDSLPLL